MKQRQIEFTIIKHIAGKIQFQGFKSLEEAVKFYKKSNMHKNINDNQSSPKDLIDNLNNTKTVSTTYYTLCTL